MPDAKNNLAYCTYLPYFRLKVGYVPYDPCPYPDGDEDDIPESFDNCLTTSNADQFDFYPPGGNGIGDACDCEIVRVTLTVTQTPTVLTQHLLRRIMAEAA